MKKHIKKLVEMLTYKRAEGSIGQRLFNERFILPLMGKPDKFDNYICEVTKHGVIKSFKDSEYPKSSIAFMAHHDTVHRDDGRQKVYHDPVKNIVYSDSNCLGADCTTGVWLILEMIKAKVPGLYIIHSGEECGGIGSSSLVRSRPKWLTNIDVAISFDRMATTSIITHQSGQRTCSEKFVLDLESILNLNLISDSGGTYTDSYEYVDWVSECTNLSVGYYNQHTKNEYQDLTFAELLLERLIAADWTKLRGYRDPTTVEYDDWTPKHGQGWTSSFRSMFDDDYYGSGAKGQQWSNYTASDEEVLDNKYRSLQAVVEAFPTEVAEILSEYGFDKIGLIRDILTHHDRF